MSARPAIRHETERDFQTAVIALARRTGHLVAHHHDSRRSIGRDRLVGDADAAGLPDLIICGRGRVIFAELKAQRGRLSAQQHVWLEALGHVEQASGGRVLARCWRPDCWPEVRALLTGGGV